MSTLAISLVAASAALMGLTFPSEASPVVREHSSLMRARRLLDEGKTLEARELYSKELKRDPKSIEAIRGLALCARDEGDDETAFRHFQELTALVPKDLAGWRQQALAASRLGRDMEALAAAQAALALSPDGDRAMTDLMTRLLASKEGFRGGAVEDPFAGVGPTSRTRRTGAIDPAGRIPKPKTPEPTLDLPKPGRGE